MERNAIGREGQGTVGQGTGGATQFPCPMPLVPHAPLAHTLSATHHSPSQPIALVQSLLFWSTAALLVFGQLMILRAWWAGRTPAAGSTRRPRASEFVWIALPVLVLSATLALTWRARHALPQPPPNEPAHVHPDAAS